MQQRIQITVLTLITAILAACGAPPGQQFVELPTVAQLPTETATASPTFTPSATHTLIPTITGTATVSITPSITVTPSQTITDTPTLPPSATYTITPVPRQLTGLDALAELARQATILPPDFAIDGTPIRNGGQFVVPSQGDGSFSVPTPTPEPRNVVCEFIGVDGFGVLEAREPAVRSGLGCPVGAPPTVLRVNSAMQSFQNGFMIWLENPGAPGDIYVLLNNGTFQLFTDTWTQGVDPDSGGLSAPPGLVEPIRGFGKVWREQPGVRDSIGWAIGGEQGGQAVEGPYEHGILVYLPQRSEILMFVNTGQWTNYQGTF